jgi:hypothetical protein
LGDSVEPMVDDCAAKSTKGSTYSGNLVCFYPDLLGRKKVVSVWSISNRARQGNELVP